MSNETRSLSAYIAERRVIGNVAHSSSSNSSNGEPNTAVAAAARIDFGEIDDYRWCDSRSIDLRWRSAVVVFDSSNVFCLHSLFSSLLAALDATKRIACTSIGIR